MYPSTILRLLYLGLAFLNLNAVLSRPTDDKCSDTSTATQVYFSSVSKVLTRFREELLFFCYLLIDRRKFWPILLLIFAVLSCARPSDSTKEVPTKMYNLTCYYTHKRLPRVWRIESWMEGTTIADLPEIVLFTGLMFAILCFYNKCGSLFTGFLINEFHNLTEKIKTLVKKIGIKLKENKIEYLGAVFQILNIAFSSSLLRDAQIWKSYLIAGIGIFTFLCYSVEVSVELRRLEVTRTYIRPERMNNIVVWFFTKQHVLQCLIPLVTCVYKSHQLEDARESVSFIIQMSIHVGAQLAFMYARDRYYFYAAN